MVIQSTAQRRLPPGNDPPSAPLLEEMKHNPPSRPAHFAAMVLIGDGVMALVHPSRDAHAWSSGPRFWRVAMRALAQRPNLTRAIGATQLAAGIWWALRQTRDQ